jgi:hypothetical protein
MGMTVSCGISVVRVEEGNVKNLSNPCHFWRRETVFATVAPLSGSIGVARGAEFSPKPFWG